MPSIIRYPVLIENAGTNFSAHCPDLPGCVSTGATLEEVEKNMKEALNLHVEGMNEEWMLIPQPSQVAWVEVTKN